MIYIEYNIYVYIMQYFILSFNSYMPMYMFNHVYICIYVAYVHNIHTHYVCAHYIIFSLLTVAWLYIT